MSDFNGQTHEAEPRSIAEAIAEVHARSARERREKEARAAAKAAEDRQRQALAVVKHRQPQGLARASVQALARGLVPWIKEAVLEPINKRLAALEAATGVGMDKGARPGVEAISPVIANYIEARLARIEALVRDLDGDAMRFADVYKSGKTYKRGQIATYKGGLWLCLACTDTKPGTGDWKLVVKSGAFGPRDDGTKKNDDEA